MKDPKKVAMGKASRAQGKQFELRVRKDLEEQGWIVDRWTNNVEFEDISFKRDHSTTGFNNIISREGKIVPAKSKWAGSGRPMMMGAGFPDFLCIRMHIKGELLCRGIISNTLYKVIGVECKMTGKLDKEEKEKCDWYLKNNIFSKIFIASKHKVKNKIVVEYEEYGN